MGRFDKPKPKEEPYRCPRNVHGWVLDPIRKSDRMTWLVCAACKAHGIISPIAWQESTDKELMQRPDDEELKKYV